MASLRDLLSHTCSVQALIAFACLLLRHRLTHRSVSLNIRTYNSQLRQALAWARRGHRPRTRSNVNALSSLFKSRARRSQYKSYQVQKARLRSADCILYMTRVRTRVKWRIAAEVPRNTNTRPDHFRKALARFRLSHSWTHLWQSKAPRKCKARRCNPALTSPVHVTHAFDNNLDAILATTRSMPRMKATVLNQASNAFAFSLCNHLFSTLRRADVALMECPSRKR